MADSAETGIAVTVGPRTSAARLLNAEYLRFVITANASPALSLMQTALLILILIPPAASGRRAEGRGLHRGTAGYSTSERFQWWRRTIYCRVDDRLALRGVN